MPAAGRQGAAAARLILLGTAGGTITDPPWHPVPAQPRHGISSLLEVGDALYLVDFGAGASRQMTMALLPDTPPRRTMCRLQAGFITHLHSDHVLDLPNVVFSGLNQGWPDHVVPILGPGSREVDVAAPIGPGALVPGTAAMVDSLRVLLAADLYERVERHGRRSLAEMVTGVDISIKPESEVPAEPQRVYEDDHVRVSATLVDHGEMRPAFGYRFDMEAGSVVFSGDTAPSANLIRLANGADILVHEAVHESIGDLMFGPGPLRTRERDIVLRVMAKHTRVDEVGAVAQAAGVGTLVLSHLGPASAPSEVWADGVCGFDGRVIVGTDLLEVRL